MSALNSRHFRQALGSLIGQPATSSFWPHFEDNPCEADLLAAVDAYDSAAGGLILPSAMSSVFVLPTRVSIFSDLLLKRRSVLVQLLMDRCDDTVLVADSHLSGKDSLHLVRLAEDVGVITSWMSVMSPQRMSLTIRPIDDQYRLVIASLASFVHPGVS